MEHSLTGRDTPIPIKLFSDIIGHGMNREQPFEQYKEDIDKLLKHDYQEEHVNIIDTAFKLEFKVETFPELIKKIKPSSIRPPWLIGGVRNLNPTIPPKMHLALKLVCTLFAGAKCVGAFFLFMANYVACIFIIPMIWAEALEVFYESVCGEAGKELAKIWGEVPENERARENYIIRNIRTTNQILPVQQRRGGANVATASLKDVMELFHTVYPSIRRVNKDAKLMLADLVTKNTKKHMLTIMRNSSDIAFYEKGKVTMSPDDIDKAITHAKTMASIRRRWVK